MGSSTNTASFRPSGATTLALPESIATLSMRLSLLDVGLHNSTFPREGRFFKCAQDSGRYLLTDTTEHTSSDTHCLRVLRILGTLPSHRRSNHIAHIYQPFVAP